jgi:hypothetical protein
MRRRTLAVVGTVLTLLISTNLFCAVSHALPLLRVSSSGGRDGKSIETALVVNASNEIDGVTSEYVWLAYHYPLHTMEGQSLDFSGNRPYDVISQRAPDGTLEIVYFDIGSFYGTWE